MAIAFNSGYDNSPHKKANPIERGTVYSGTAMSFDGVTDYIKTGINPALAFGTGDFTLTLRFNADATQSTNYPTFMQISDATDNYTNFQFYASSHSAGELRIDMSSGAGSASVTFDDFAYTHDVWWHLGLVRTGGNVLLYMNGELVQTESYTPNDMIPGYLWVAVNHIPASYEFAGEMSNIQWWNTALTLEQIQQLYKQPELLLPTGTTASNVVGQYLLNEGAGYTAFDSHIPSGEKKFGETSIVLDGSDSIYIANHDDFDFGDGDFTFECFLNLSSFVHDKSIIHKTNGSLDVALNTDGSVTSPGGNHLRFTVGTDSGNYTLHWGTGIVTDTWYHLAVQRSGSTLESFLNGVAKETTSVSGDNHLSTDPLSWGASSGGSYGITGYLDEMRVSNVARYDSAGFDAITSAFVSDVNTIFLVHADNSKNRPAGGIVDSSPSSHAITVVGDAKLTDYRSHGTVTGATWSTGNNEVYQTGLVKGRRAMIFEGNTKAIVIGNSVSLKLNHLTLFAWVSTLSGTTSFDSIIAKSEAYAFGIDDNVVKAYDWDNDAWRSGSKVINDGALHLICMTITNDTTGQFYVDGVADGNSFDYGIKNQDSDLWIGNTSLATSEGFDGIVFETGIYNTVLSPSEITTLYNNGIPYDATNIESANLFGYWKNQGVDTWTDNSTKGTAVFDGSTSRLVCSSIDPGTTYTFATWIKPTAIGTGDVGYIFEGGGKGLAINEGTGGATSNYVYYYSPSTNLTSTILTNNVWCHLVVTFNDPASEIKSYINGAYIETATNSTLDNDIDTIGMYGTGNPLACHMANTSIWDEVLTAEEISALYAIDKFADISGVSFFSKCLANWRMGAGTGDTASTIQDQTSNNKDLTVTSTGIVGLNDGTIDVTGLDSLFLPEGNTADKDILSFPLADTAADVLSLYDPAYFEFLPNSDLAFGSKDFTVEFWINIQELATGVLIGNAWGSAITDRAGWSLYWFAGDGKLYLSWSNVVGASFVGDLSQTWTPDLNTWIHFHLIKSGTTFSFYQNNVIIGSGMSETDPMPTELTKPFRLSSDPDDSAANFFNARYDELRVYHKALSSAERIQNYNHGAIAHGKTIIE